MDSNSVLTPRPRTAEVQIPERGRVQLSNPELEAAVLNKLLSSPYGIDQALQSLSPYCFYDEQHRRVYDAIRQVYDDGRSVSYASVTEQLHSQYSADEAQRLIATTSIVYGHPEEMMMLDEIVTILTMYRQRRELMPAAYRLLDLSSQLNSDLTEGVEQVQREIEEAMSGSLRIDFSTMSQYLDQAVQVTRDNLQPGTRHTGILTGIPQFDEEGGLPDHSLIVIAGRSSHGKTSFANFLALGAMKHGARVVYYSMEMTNLQLTQRMLAMESGIPCSTLARKPLTADEQQRVAAAVELLKASHAECVAFDERGIRTLVRIVQSIRCLKRTQGLDLVVVDYLQLLGIDPQTHTDTTQAQLYGWVAHRLHDIAVELGLTILLLSQINRTSQGMPSRHELRGSGEIDEAADMTILMYNPAADQLSAGQFPAPFDGVDIKDHVLIDAGKNRNGAQMMFVMGFNPKITSFSNLTAEETAEISGDEQTLKALSAGSAAAAASRSAAASQSAPARRRKRRIKDEGPSLEGL